MQDTIPQTSPPAGPPGAPFADEVERLREQVLDLGEHLATVTAEHAADRARIEAFLAALDLARTWPGGAAPGGGPLPGTGAQGGAHAGPRVLKVQARRRRIEASGLRGLPGGAR